VGFFRSRADFLVDRFFQTLAALPGNMSATGASSVRSRNLRTIAALAALFVLPLLLAFVMYYGGWRPEQQSIHGELFEPARPLPQIDLPVLGGPADHKAFVDHWSMVYIGDGQCGDECRRALHVMRQSWLLLNKDMDRVRRVFLVTGGCCDREFLQREHTGLLLLDASSAEAAPLLTAFVSPQQRRSSFAVDSQSQHSLFVVDPLGNLVLSFDTRRNPKGLLADLRKLLRLSHIG
jgi:hypothetical protein